MCFDGPIEGPNKRNKTSYFVYKNSLFQGCDIVCMFVDLNACCIIDPRFGRSVVEFQTEVYIHSMSSRTQNVLESEFQCNPTVEDLANHIHT